MIERELLAERGAGFIVARRVCALACGSQAADGRLDRARVHLVQLFDVGDDGSDLRRERSQLLVRQFEMREGGDLGDIGFGDWHYDDF